PNPKRLDDEGRVPFKNDDTESSPLNEGNDDSATTFIEDNAHPESNTEGYPHLSKLVNLLTPICMGEILHSLTLGLTPNPKRLDDEGRVPFKNDDTESSPLNEGNDDSATTFIEDNAH
nr:hypothetical protein [Tanacetum cinerariifolium]